MTDAISNSPRGKVFFDKFQILDGQFHCARLVIVVVDGEIARQCSLSSFAPQKPRAKGMKGRNPCIGGILPAGSDEIADALFHLVRGFVGKRYGKNIPRGRTLFDEIGDTIRDDARLARAGACEHEHRTLRGENGFTLLRIEILKKIHRIRFESEVESKERKSKINSSRAPCLGQT